MSNIWESVKSKQGKLEGFAQSGLFCLIGLKVCGNCKAEEDCDDCAGLAVLTHLENQIMDEGILFMKSLVKDWAAGNRDK